MEEKDILRVTLARGEDGTPAHSVTFVHIQTADSSFRQDCPPLQLCSTSSFPEKIHSSSPFQEIAKARNTNPQCNSKTNRRNLDTSCHLYFPSVSNFLMNSLFLFLTEESPGTIWGKKIQIKILKARWWLLTLDAKLPLVSCNLKWKKK